MALLRLLGIIICAIVAVMGLWLDQGDLPALIGLLAAGVGCIAAANVNWTR